MTSVLLVSSAASQSFEALIYEFHKLHKHMALLQTLQALERRFLCCPYRMWRGSSADRDRLAQALHWMAHAGLANSTDNIDWMLTSAACGQLKAIRQLHRPQKVFDPSASKEVPVEKKSKLELMFHMHSHGWHLQIHGRQSRRQRRPPHFCGAEDELKVYWVDEVSLVLHKEYLLCLLKATEIEGGVPHLLSKGTYSNLLEGKPARARRRAEAFATLEVGQAVHRALPLLHPRPSAAIGRRRPHNKPSSQPLASAVASQGSGSSGSSSGSSSDNQSDSSHHDVHNPPSQPGPAVQVEEGHPALSPDMPETQTADLAKEVKSQLSSSITTTQSEEAKVVNLPHLIEDIKYVQSRAGGFVYGCGHPGCSEEATVACPACTVMLCDYHNGLFGPQHMTSRCHEHNVGDFARLICPCQECKPPAPTQPVSATEDNTGQGQGGQQSNTSSSPSSPSSSSSSSSSASSSSSDSEAGPGDEDAHSRASSSNRSVNSDGHSTPPEAGAALPGDVLEEHATRGALLQTTSFWKTCRFTVVKDKGLEVGLEVTCRDPRHHQKGLPPCRRTLRFAKYGGVARVQRLLKWWLVQSHGYGNREAHVLQCPKAPDVLPTSEQLEAEQLNYLPPSEHSEGAASPDRDADHAPRPKPGPKAKRRRKH